MNNNGQSYLLAQAPNEVERLSSWADTWKPAAERLFDKIAIQPGWHCLDLGCGPRGVLDLLSRRAGPAGRVVGVDLSQANLEAAGKIIKTRGLTNVELIQADAMQTGMPPRSFDLVHVRFMFTPLGREDELLREMLRLARPGGILAAQESSQETYECYPPQAAWQRLKEVTIAAFSLTGGNYNAGRRIYGQFRLTGLEQVQGDAAVLGLPAGHVFRRWPLESALALKPRILEAGLMTEGDFEQTLAACQRIADDPDIWMTSFMVTQVWGYKPVGVIE